MAKKKYEKPQLKGEKLFEAAAKTCCKPDNTTCPSSAQSSGGKSNRGQVTS